MAKWCGFPMQRGAAGPRNGSFQCHLSRQIKRTNTANTHYLSFFPRSDFHAWSMLKIESYFDPDWFSKTYRHHLITRKRPSMIFPEATFPMRIERRQCRSKGYPLGYDQHFPSLSVIKHFHLHFDFRRTNVTAPQLLTSNTWALRPLRMLKPTSI